MADKSQRGFYLVVEEIKNELINNPSIKTMTFGDITDIDLGKQTIFPLAHMIIENVVHAEKTMQFSFTILTMEQIDTTKDYVNDLFLGNSNTHDILNTQLMQFLINLLQNLEKDRCMKMAINL